MASACFKHNCHFQAFVEEHKFGVEDGLTGGLDLVLLVSFYNLRKDRKDNIAGNNVVWLGVFK